MAQIESWFNQDLKEPVKVRYLDGNVFSQDNNGNLIGVYVFNNGEPATLSGSVSASIIRSDGGTVAAVGTLSGNQVSVILPQSAYAIPGVISVVIKLTSGSDVTTLCAVVGNVYTSSTDTVIDPGTIIPSVETLIAAIDAAVASIPADYSSLWTSLAPAYSTSGTYAVGDYVTYNGGLYRCVTAISSGESWTAAHWTSAKLGTDVSALKSALSDNTGTEIIAIDETGKYIQMTGDTAVEKTSANFKYSKVACQPGDVFTVSAEGAGGARCWGWLDSNNGVISKATEGATVTNEIMIAPENSAYLVINNKVTNNRVSYKGELIKHITDMALIYNSNPSTNDLNDYVKPGYYILGSSTTYTNSPLEDESTFTGSRILEAMPSFVEGSAFLVQILWVLSSTYAGNVYARRRTGTPSQQSWTDWTKINSMKEQEMIKEQYEGFRTLETTDVNDATDTGYYILGSSTDYVNLPEEIRPLPNGPTASGAKTLEVMPSFSSGSVYLVQTLWILSSTYAGNIYARRRTGSASNPNWTDWIKVSSIKDMQTALRFLNNTELQNYEPVSRNSQGNNVGAKIRVMSYNICHFNNDTSTYISAEKLGNLHKMFMEVNADFICLQEDDRHIDSAETKLSKSYLYYPVYPISVVDDVYPDNDTAGVNIRSKQGFASRDSLEFSNTNHRALRYGVYEIDGKTLLLISAHPGLTEEERAEEYEKLFKWINGEITLNRYYTSTPVSVPTFTHCVIGMDANSATAEDRANLSAEAEEAGYIMANGGVLGWINTSLRSNLPLDNIIVSPNVIINNIQVLSGWYDLLYSDHVPVYCDLTLLDT